VGAGEQLQGQGRIVLTASDALQYSFEGDHVQGEGVRSVFTRTLVQGLEPGEADLDRDGLFSLDEVYDYVYSRVSDEQPDQKPTKMGFTEGRIFIGSNPRPLAGRLPQDILDTLEHPLVWVRVGAVQQLETLLESSSKGLVLAAQAKLSFLAANDDSQQVRAAAAKCLASRVIVPPSPEEAGPVAELKIEVEVQAPERERPTREKPTKTRRGKAQTDWQSRSVEGNKRRAEKAEVQRKGRAKPALPAAPEVVQATRVTSPGNERESLSLRGHSDAIWSVAWSLDGARLATASDDGTVKVWNAETGQELLTLRGHGGCVRRVDWTIDLDDTPPENWLAAASTDGWFKIWDADIGEDEMDDVVGGEGWLMAWRPRLHGEPKPKSDASWLNRLRKSTPSEERMELTSLAHNVSAGEAWDDSPLGGVAVRKVRTGETLPILHHREVVRSIAWSPDGMRMARGTINGTVRVWMVEKGKELLSMAAHAGPVTSLTWSPDGYRMASASEDGKVNVYGTRVGELLLSVTPPSHPSKLWGVAWSPRANSLATGSDDQTARVWNVETGGELLTLRGHSGAVRSLAWSPDGKRLTTGSDDKTAKVWDVSH
jgi:WD40 repeat protein